MPVSDKDRRDYERGLKDRKAGIFPRLVGDVLGDVKDSEAYWKGRRGEPLDADKKRDETK